MDIISYTLSNMFRDNASMLMALLVFTGTTAFALMAFARVRGAVKRTSHPGRRARGQADALAALFEPEGGDPALGIHHQTLRRDQ